MLEKEFDIASLIAGYQAGILTEEEGKRLQAWVDGSAERRRLFETISDVKNFRELTDMARRYDRQRAWMKVESRIRPARFVVFRKYAAYAALFSLPLVICYFLLKQAAEEYDASLAPTVAIGEKITPGSQKAVLTLGDGTVVDLEKENSFELEEKGGTTIRKDSATLNYRKNADSLPAEKVVYNRIDIPRGGEYSLVLSDGSRVHLNAMSSLRYPVNFTGDKRVVELEGEAYFEVAKGKRPFIVRAGEVQVKVLGTEFNVNCYADEKMIRTTLVRGSIRLHDTGGNSFLLKPSQQARFCRATGKTKVREVDVSMYTAWKDGFFRFQDWRLEDIMTYLSRWYDVNVFYSDPKVKDFRFGCSISRYGDIEPILKLFEETGKVSAEIKGKTIVFR